MDPLTNQPTDRVRLSDGGTARVVVAPVTITTLQVPTVITRARVIDRLVGVTRELDLPRLVGKAALPAGSGAGGPSTGAGGDVTYVQAWPLLVWRFVHPFGRRPMVDVFYGLGDDAEEADTDVRATALEVVVEWAEPTVGSVILR